MNKHKYYSVMLFFRAYDLGMTGYGEDEWINSRNIDYTNGTAALECYANTRCPASQLISADTIEELNEEKKRMAENYQNEDWLEENLYPYL